MMKHGKTPGMPAKAVMHPVSGGYHTAVEMRFEEEIARERAKHHPRPRESYAKSRK